MSEELKLDEFAFVAGLLTIEIVSALSPNSSIAEDRLTAISNRLDEFARATTNPRVKLIASALATALIQTEDSGL